MDLHDSGEFTRRLVAVGELFEANLTPAKQAMYFEALRDVPFDLVARALSAAIKACTFMPKPAELRKLALGDDDDHTERAWLLFRDAMRHAGAYSSIATMDAALGDTIAALFGGWPEACDCEFSPEMWAAKRKEFGRVYRVCRDRGVWGVRYLAGLSERGNHGREEWQKYVPLAVLDGTTIQQLTGADAEGFRAVLAAATPGGWAQMTSGAVRALPAVRDESA